MKKEVSGQLRQISLFILLLSASAYTAKAQYTLTDDDVVVSDGVIQSCSYDFAIRDIIIPSKLDGQTVTEIFDGVFNFKGLTNVDFSNCTSLTSIGKFAFSFNYLDSLDLSACTSLTSIGAEAFSLNYLANVDLSACNSLTSIKRRAFNSNSISKINLPNNITYIGGAAFNNNKIDTVNGTLSDGFIYARNADASTDSTTLVSYGGTLTNVTIPAQVEKIGSSAFYSSSITSVDFGACTSLKSIEGSAFRENSLISLDLSACNTLDSIKSYAFLSNSLTEIILPNSVTYIGGAVFNRNEINRVNGKSSEGIIYSRNANANIDSSIIVSYGGTLKNVIIPAQVKKIETYAFAHSSLTNVDLSACSALSSISDHAFWDNVLKNIDFSNCTSLISIDKSAFSSNLLEGIDLSACSSLSYIGGSAFDYNNFSVFVLPTPIVSGFKNWQDGKGNEYLGGAYVNDLNTSYTANIITGVSKSADSRINIYPNPATNYLTITQTANEVIKSIELYNLQGQKIMLYPIDQNQEMIKLDIQNLKKGIYILKCITNNNNILSKVIIKE